MELWVAKGQVIRSFYVFKGENAVYSAPYIHYVTEDFLQKRYPNKQGVRYAISNVEIPKLQLVF